MRAAIAYCVNRSYEVSITGGLALPIYTPVPSYMAGYINSTISPSGTGSQWTYGGFTGNLATAAAILDAHFFPIGPEGWRYWDMNHNGVKDAGEDLNLIFYTRGGNRGAIGSDIATNLNTIGIMNTGNTFGFSYVPRSRVIGPVFAQKYFNLYTGGWTGIGPDPDYLDDLYDGSNYYHPGSPPNYDGINYSDSNLALSTLKTAPTPAIGNASAWDAQYYLAKHAAMVPLCSASGVKAYRNVPVAAGAAGNWTNLVNQKGQGVNSWWSTLDMHQSLYPDNYTYYGFSSTVSLQNIVYAQWYWDMEVLGRIYDGGAGRDPMTLATWVPQLYKSWTPSLWNDQGVNKTKVTITLRPDVYWQDGQPLTIADVYYTLVECSKDIIDPTRPGGPLPPPWWYPTVQYMRSVTIIDAYNIEILLDVQGTWAMDWVIGSVVIPKHIWLPIIGVPNGSGGWTTAPSGAANAVQGTMPDPHMIGTGPFRWSSGSGEAVGSTVVLVANKPGSIVNGITSPAGYYLYNPNYIDIAPDNNLYKINLNPTDTSVISNITITWRNLAYASYIIENAYVYLNGALQPGYPHDVNLTTVTPYPLGTSHVETLNLNLTKAHLYYVTVASHIKGPSTIGGEPNPWISQWVNVTIPIWVTMREDIAGTTLYDVLGYGAYPAWLKNEAPAPDLKVDVNDLIKVAKAYDSYPGQPRWDPVADLNGDYRVDMADLTMVYLAWGGVSGVPQDIAITDVALSKRIVFQGYSVKTNVTFANLGSLSQDCSLSVLFGGNTTRTCSVSLDPGTSTTRIFDVFARAFLFEEVGRTSPSGSMSPQQGNFTIHGTGTYVNASTGTIPGILNMSGGIIDLYYSNGTLITHREVLIPPDRTGIVFTAGNYSDGLYVLGTTDGELCFLDDNGEYGELSVALTPVNDLKLDALNVTACTSISDIILRRYSTDFRLPKGNFSVSAHVDPVLGETNLADNNFTGGWVVVSMVGDLTGGTSNPWDFVPDGKCDGKDITIVALCFGSAPGCPPPYTWNPNSDVNNDAKIDGKDIATVALHFGQADP
jgi:ABC-type transport system substrate-binding protein